MVKALAFKGDKKVKKRKRTAAEEDERNGSASNKQQQQLATQAQEEQAAEENWVSATATEDISGPVVLVLPTSPVTCLACDANGKVFASKIENMVEDSPSTAEPHDVRQVWIATRAGTETFSFKGHHGKYLGCDKFGIPSATSDAISPEESLFCEPYRDEVVDAFSVRTARDTYLSVGEGKSGPEIRADSESLGPSTAIRVRMQARFKPSLKVFREEKVREKISKAQLEQDVGRRLEDAEVKKLKKARKDGSYHEALLDVKVKSKHDKFA